MKEESTTCCYAVNCDRDEYEMIRYRIETVSRMVQDGYKKGYAIRHVTEVAEKWTFARLDSAAN